MNPTEDSNYGDVPKEMFEAVEHISLNLLPDKSRQIYMDTYTKFTD